MITSMTGFASAEHEIAGGILNVELRSVNHRYLEILFKIDDSFRSFEPTIRSLIQAQLRRGKVDCKLYLKQNNALSQSHAVNLEALEQLSALVKSTAEHFNDVQAVNVLDVLNMPGIMQTQTIESDALLAAIQVAVPQALEALSLARQREGDKLKTVILERLDEVAGLITTVKPMMPDLLKAYQAKLTTKLQEAMVADDDRVRQEIVMYAQKIDVDEELSRLDAHVAEVRSILTGGGVVGKRLDFLMQEMNREANTLGSKSVAIETTKISMQLKVLIEQMREQIQNIE